MNTERKPRIERLNLRLTPGEKKSVQLFAAARGLDAASAAREAMLAGMAASVGPANDAPRADELPQLIREVFSPLFDEARKAQTAELKSLFNSLREKWFPAAIVAAGGTPPKA